VKITRHRLNPGRDHQANQARWRIVFTRLGSHPVTRAERRSSEHLVCHGMVTIVLLGPRHPSLAPSPSSSA
jgi:hypothetical protein